MPKGSAATSSRSPPTPASSWGRWRSRTSTISKDSPRRSRSTRRAPRATRARPSAPSPRSTTTSASSSRASATRIARTAAARSRRQSPQQIVESLQGLPEGTRLMLLAPLISDRKGEHLGLFEDARRAGFVRVRVNGTVYELDEVPKLAKYKKHTIEVVVDRLVIRHRRTTMAMRRPLAPARFGRDGAEARRRDRQRRHRADRRRSGAGDDLLRAPGLPERAGSAPGEIEPRNFSFNAPQGACPACTGLGMVQEFDPELVIPNPDLTLGEGAVQPWVRATQSASGYYQAILESLAKHYGFSTSVPVRDLPESGDQADPLRERQRDHQGRLREAATAGKRIHQMTFEGVIPNLRRRYSETSSDYIRDEIERYMTQRPCPTCKGSRLKPENLAVTIDGKSIAEITRMAITEALRWAKALEGRDDVALDRAPHRPRGADRAPGAQGDPRTSRLPRRCGPRLSDARPLRHHASPAARRSASGWRPRSVPA